MPKSKAPSPRKLARIRQELEAELLLDPKKKWVPERNMHRARRWKGYNLQRSKAMLKDWTANPHHNVVGLGIGYKRVGRRESKKRCIVFYVIRKTSNRQRIRKGYVIPKEIDGVPTDVIEVGIPRAASLPGESIGLVAHGSHNVTGTLGLYVRRGQQIFILSNNHVLADEGRVPLNTAIVSPGPGIAGNPVPIGTLSEFVPAAWDTSNIVDCAIAEIQPGAAWQNTIPGFGAINGVASPRGGRQVVKRGQSTGVTTGITLSNTKLSMVFNYPHASMVMFTNLMGIIGVGGSLFASDGDSGSAIVDDQTGNAVGLLIGVAENGIAFANHMPTVMTQLNVQLA
jgi:hypothetical protein